MKRKLDRNLLRRLSYQPKTKSKPSKPIKHPSLKTILGNLRFCLMNGERYLDHAEKLIISARVELKVVKEQLGRLPNPLPSASKKSKPRKKKSNSENWKASLGRAWGE